MKVQILGTGCAKCKQLTINVQEAVTQIGLNAEVVKVSDITEIMALGVISTPGLAVDNQVLSSGRLLSVEESKSILTHFLATTSTKESSCCASESSTSCACVNSGNKSTCDCETNPKSGGCCGGEKSNSQTNCGCSGGASCCSKNPFKLILILFVIFSVIYALTQNSDSCSSSCTTPQTNDQTSVVVTPNPSVNTTVVYYFHATKRCFTCNKIEDFTKKALTNKFADEQAHGKVIFQSINLDDQANEHFKKDFGLTFNCVVVAHNNQFERLEKVWELVKKTPEEFTTYIETAVRKISEAK